MTAPVKVTAPSSRVPVDEIVFVPPPVNDRSAPDPVNVSPVVPVSVSLPLMVVLFARVISPDPAVTVTFPVVALPRFRDC